MADAAEFNGELSDDQSVVITGDESSAKISLLNQKLTDLERENSVSVRENDGYKQKIEELKASITELSVENEELKNQVGEAESENKAFVSVAARAAELEGEVSRLHQDLASAMSDLQETTVELSDLKRVLEGVRESDKEKGVKLEAIGKERDLLLEKVEKLERADSNLRDESDGKEKEIQILKQNIEELVVAVENGKSVEKLKDDLEKTIEKMKEEIISLEANLKEQEKVISGFPVKERSIANDVNGDSLIEGEKKGLDWVVVGGSTIAAIVVMGIACYIHTSKKQ